MLEPPKLLVLYGISGSLHEQQVGQEVEFLDVQSVVFGDFHGQSAAWLLSVQVSQQRVSLAVDYSSVVAWPLSALASQYSKSLLLSTTHLL